MNSRRIHLVMLALAAVFVGRILLSSEPKDENQAPAKKAQVVTSQAYVDHTSVREEEPAPIQVEPGQFTVQRDLDLR